MMMMYSPNRLHNNSITQTKRELGDHVGWELKNFMKTKVSRRRDACLLAYDRRACHSFIIILFLITIVVVL